MLISHSMSALLAAAPAASFDWGTFWAYAGVAIALVALLIVVLTSGQKQLQTRLKVQDELLSTKLQAQSDLLSERINAAVTLLQERIAAVDRAQSERASRDAERLEVQIGTAGQNVQRLGTRLDTQLGTISRQIDRLHR